MWVFYILLFLPMLIRLLKTQGRDIGSQKANQTALGIFFLMLTVLVMFRHESVGSDTRNYLSFFRRYVVLDWKELSNEALEIGYAWLNKIVSLISKKEQVFLACTGVIVGILLYRTYKRLCIDSTLTIVLFCSMTTFVMMFSGIRQMLAIAIGFVAYDFTRKKKLLGFALVVILAISMHTSAVMLVFMYPLYHMKVTRNSLIFVVPLLGLVFAFNEPIFSFLSTYIEKYTRFDAEISSTGAYTMIVLLAIFAIFSFVIPDESALDEETFGMRNFLLMSLALQMFAPLHTLAMRMNYYYIIFIPLLIPKIVSARSKWWRNVASISRPIMIVFFLVYFFYNAYTSDSTLHVFPYHFFWESV